LAEILIPKAFKSLFEPKRYKVLYGGRGGAKSHNIARALLVLGMQKPMRIVCAREIQKSIKDSVHALLSDIIAEHDLAGFYAVQETMIRGVNGTQFIFRGLKHNTTDLKSLEGADICWVEEAENVSDRSWEILIPTIRKESSEIWISFNPKNATDPTYERFVANADHRMHVQKVSWRDNPFFPAVMNEERLALQAKSKDAYEHVWEGAFDTRRDGSIFATYIDKARQENRICAVPYKPGVPVHTAWDLGKRNATAIVFGQVVGLQPRIIDYHEATGSEADLAKLAAVIRSKPYEYGKHFLPHDAAHERLGMTGSISAQLNTLGIANQVLSIGPKAAQRTAGQALLQECFIDETRCKDLVHALMNYRFEWDEDRKTFKDEPYKDWTTDGADAFQYFAVVWEANQLSTNLITATDYKPPTFHGEGAWMG
jgi:phage terminase large subunit